MGVQVSKIAKNRANVEIIMAELGLGLEKISWKIVSWAMTIGEFKRLSPSWSTDQTFLLQELPDILPLAHHKKV
jgi:hypothetical protein